MAYAAFLRENVILVLSQGGAFAFFLSPTMGFLYELPDPTIGHL